ncbi:hypothetical protein [Streptomyces sp. SYSU K217416]
MAPPIRPRCWSARAAGGAGAPVTARQDRADGTVVYQVAVDLDGSTSATTRLNAWPQPGLRVGHRSASEPSDRLPFATSMPHAPPP